MTQQTAPESEPARASASFWADPDTPPEQFAAGLLRSVLAMVPARGSLLVEPASDAPLVADGPEAAALTAAWAGLSPSARELGIAKIEGPGSGESERWLLASACAVAEREHLVAVAFVVGDRGFAERARWRLELLTRMASLWSTVRSLRGQSGAKDGALDALGVLASLQDERRFFTGSLTICDELASRWEAERVSIGRVVNGSVVMVAVSHTEKISKEAPLVRSLQTVMEEAGDQDREVLTPPDETDAVVCRAGREHLDGHRVSSCLALPLRAGGGVVGAVVLEWADGPRLDRRRLEALRLTLDLLTPRWLDLRDRDRWIGARARDAVRGALSSLVGPRHTWAKAAALVVTAFLGFAFFVKGPVRVTADAVLESTSRRVVPAPYDAFLHSSSRRVGDAVRAGEVLAELETSDLRLELARLRAQELASRTEESIAKRDGETAKAQIAAAAAASTAAERRLVEAQLSKAVIVSPIDGVITEGDLERLIGAPVAVGDELFVIEPAGSLRAEIHIPEGRIAEVGSGSRGVFAAASFPDERVPFTVTRVDPVARVIDGENVFVARVELGSRAPWMRPGMEGVAKISAGRSAYAVIWTRDLVDWVRMKLWI